MEHSHCLPLTPSSYAVILISDRTLTWSHTVFLCSHSILDTTSATEHSHCLPLTLSSYAVILYLMLHQWPNTHMVSHCLMQSFYTWHYISDWTLTPSHTVFLCSHSILDTTSVTELSHHLTLSSYAVILYLTPHQWLNTHTGFAVVLLHMCRGL